MLICVCVCVRVCVCVWGGWGALPLYGSTEGICSTTKAPVCLSGEGVLAATPNLIGWGHTPPRNPHPRGHARTPGRSRAFFFSLLNKGVT